MLNFLSSTEIWATVIKVLITFILSACLGLIGTLIGHIVSKNKNSKIHKYAKVCVKAAEQKFPNQGKKMGPEKMAYVMDQLAIKFPKIKSNSYLYNIAEAAVFEFNRKDQEAEAIREFEEKYGEKPLAALANNKNINEETIDVNKTNTDVTKETTSVTDSSNMKDEQKTAESKNKKKISLKSF